MTISRAALARRSGSLLSCLALVAAVSSATVAHAVPAPIPGSGPQHEAELTDSTLLAYSGFGVTTAISGDTLAVGVPNTDTGHGAVYIYTKPAAGWRTGMTPAAILTDQTGHADEFGAEVAMSSDTLVVGAPNASQLSTTYAGAAFVFTKPATGWATTSSATSELYASDAAANDNFGASVAISGDSIVVGAPYAGGSGAGYVFVKPGAGWQPTTSQIGKLTGTFADSGDLFGDSVSISGDTVLITAPHHQDGSQTDAGLGYVFVKPAAGWSSMTQTRKLEASDAATNEAFGAYHSSSVDGSTAAIGTAAGKFYIFTEPDGGWGAATAALTETKAIGIIGATATTVVRTRVVGANLAVGIGAVTEHGVASAGVAEIYSEPTGGWSDLSGLPIFITASNAQAYDSFGDTPPAMSGDTLVVGAPYANADRGGVYVYTPAAPTLSKVSQKKASWKAGSKGTAFHVTLDEAATVKFAFAEKNKGKYRKVGAITETAQVGKSTLAFDGKIAKGTKLAAGKCEVVIAASNSHGTSKPAALKFTIKPMKK